MTDERKCPDQPGTTKSKALAPTPRCDTAIVLIGRPHGYASRLTPFVPADVARDIENEADELRAELMNIANAKRFDRERFADDDSFADWAQSRARFALENS